MPVVFYFLGSAFLRFRRSAEQNSEARGRAMLRGRPRRARDDNDKVGCRLYKYCEDYNRSRAASCRDANAATGCFRGKFLLRQSVISRAESCRNVSCVALLECRSRGKAKYNVGTDEAISRPFAGTGCMSQGRW